ncbi:MAG: phosphoribosylglycinamide formyltransferase, partial [Propionibacteriaceae bacterium]|nr:phosphoribosylglycinamide formyltransferase [Propionibacteriaceae bacterium]
MTFRVVVLLSGAGTLLQALLDASALKAAEIEIVGVVSDRAGVSGLARAESAGIPTAVVELQPDTERAEWDMQLTQCVRDFAPDLVVSAGFMKILGSSFLAEFAGRAINTHPALLPAFPGAHAVKDALEAGVKVTGATIFFIDAGVDTGPIIAQRAVAISPDDDAESLHERIKQTERQLLVTVVCELARSPEGVFNAQRQLTGQVRKGRGSMNLKPIRRALVSVYDKTGLVELGAQLRDAGVEIVSTGSTAAALTAADILVTPVEQVTGFAECLDGRVKTIHPAIHAGILADCRKESHQQQLEELGIAPFDLVISNLYPFTETVASGASIGECIEQIDIGGPAMVRAAAKNHPCVAVITSPQQYQLVAQALSDGGFSASARQDLAAAAFAHTASYDVAVATWMSNKLSDTAASGGFADWHGSVWEKRTVLRYGENSHQQAALYTDVQPWGLAGAEQLHGKEMSYNNYTDPDAAFRA